MAISASSERLAPMNARFVAPAHRTRYKQIDHWTTIGLPSGTSDNLVMKPQATVAAGTAGLRLRLACAAIGVGLFLPAAILAQTALSWQQVKEKFESSNPTLQAAQLNIDESRA